MPENFALDLAGSAFDLSIRYINMAAGSASGNFLLLSSEFDNTTTPAAGRLVAQVFDASGAAVGGRTTVAVNTSTTSNAPGPTDADALTGGGFVVAYTANASNTGGPYSEVDLATFSPAGDLLRTMRLGSSYGTPYASVAPLSDGGFVATWATAEKYQPGFTYLETFDATGAPTSGVTTLSNAMGPLLTVGGQNGSFVAVYFSSYNQRSLLEFNGKGFETPIALPVTDRVQTGAALSNGDFVFVWSVVQPNEDFKVFAQIYDPSTNSLVGGPAVLHTASGVLSDPAVVGDAAGGYVVSWQNPNYSDGAREAVTVNASGLVSETFVLTGGVEGVFGTGGSKVLTLGIAGGHVHGQAYAFTPGDGAARTLHADDTAGQRLSGGPGDDVLFAGHNSVVMSGQGGADVFVFDALPWNAGHITDFTIGVDKLDFSRLFAAAGYTGTDPQQDGRVYFQQETFSLPDHYETNTKVYFDPDGPGGQGAFLVTTLDNVMSGYTWRSVGGVAPSEPPPPPATGGSGGDGQVYNSPSPGSTVTAGAGDDTINASQGADVLTGGAGADTFAFKALPWSAGKITDFVLDTDKLDLSAIFQASGYTGSDPIADHRMTLESDGSGGTKVFFDRDAPGSGDWPFQITTLQGVSPTGLTWAKLSGSGGATSLPPTTTAQLSLTSSDGRQEGAFGQASELHFTVTRSGDTSGTSTANWSVAGSGQNPANASDFAGYVLPTGTVTFAAGETSKVITVNINGDSTAEPDETFLVTLSSPSAGTTLGTATVGGVIVNDDYGAPSEPPQLGFDVTSRSLAEGNSGVTSFTYTVSRSGTTEGASSVNWSVAGSGTNSASPADFAGGTMPGGTLNFAAGEVSKTIVVNVVGDSVVEPDEGFTVKLSGASGAGLRNLTATGTIINDDATPTDGSGQILTARQNGDTLAGGAGADTLVASQGPDRLTGGAGDDHFVFGKLVWNSGVVTDFTPGHDKLDLSGLFDTYSNGTLEARVSGANTEVYFDPDGAGGEWPSRITTLTGVTPDQLGSGWLIR